MKAVVLAGGEGSRLRPISAETPKPMVRLLDKPVMEYTVELLKKHGVTDITATLQTLPHKITDYFGDGSHWGVRMSYRVESNPLGTAGGVRACRYFAGNEPLLVISGDAVTDIDLTACAQFHRSKNALATIVLTRREQLLEYGLVMTNPDGRVARFIEKPSWGQVFTDTVNTGIYILSPEALDMIPDGVFYDFARDLFPRMLSEGLPLYGVTAEGYWCDIGDVLAYMNCCCDALDGKIDIALPAQAEIPDGVYAEQPCYVGRGALLDAGCRIGPYAVIGAGSRVRAGASVAYSVLDGVHVDTLARCEGAFAGRGSVLREGAALREGAVVGESVIVGSHAELTGNARVWPNKEIEADTRVDGSVTGGHGRRAAAFDGAGGISGQPYADLGPEFCLRLGEAIGSVARGEIALSHRGGDSARCAALALEAGICSSGGSPVLSDAPFAACAAYSSGLYRLPLSVFVKQRGDSLSIRLYDSLGLPIQRELERKIESLTARGESVTAPRPGHSRPLSGLADAHATAAAVLPEWAAELAAAPWEGRVSGGDSASAALRRTLALTGCTLSGGAGSPLFGCDEDGLRLTAVDESGQSLSHARILTMLLWLEAQAGVKLIALPYSEPAALDECALSLGISILRVGRDGDAARELYASQRHLRDACFAAARLAYGCRRHGISLSGLSERVPAFHIRSAELRLDGDRGAVMRALASTQENAELVEGLRAKVGRGWVHVAPMPGRRALRITAEGGSEELASEICDFYLEAAKKIDGQSQGAVI